MAGIATGGYRPYSTDILPQFVSLLARVSESLRRSATGGCARAAALQQAFANHSLRHTANSGQAQRLSLPQAEHQPNTDQKIARGQHATD